MAGEGGGGGGRRAIDQQRESSHSSDALGYRRGTRRTFVLASLQNAATPLAPPGDPRIIRVGLADRWCFEFGHGRARTPRVDQSTGSVCDPRTLYLPAALRCSIA